MILFRCADVPVETSKRETSLDEYRGLKKASSHGAMTITSRSRSRSMGACGGLPEELEL